MGKIYLAGVMKTPRRTLFTAVNSLLLRFDRLSVYIYKLSASPFNHESIGRKSIQVNYQARNRWVHTAQTHRIPSFLYLHPAMFWLIFACVCVCGVYTCTPRVLRLLRPIEALNHFISCSHIIQPRKPSVCESSVSGGAQLNRAATTLCIYHRYSRARLLGCKQADETKNKMRETRGRGGMNWANNKSEIKRRSGKESALIMHFLSVYNENFSFQMHDPGENIYSESNDVRVYSVRWKYTSQYRREK